MPQVEPAFEVLEPADFIGRNVGDDRLQAPVVPKILRLASTMPRQNGPVQDQIVVNCSGHHARGLLAGQPMEGLHQASHLPLGQPGFDLAEAAALHVLKGVANHRTQFLLVRPTDVERDGHAMHLGRQRQGIDQDHGPQSRIGREVQIADRADHLRVLAVRAEILEDETSGYSVFFTSRSAAMILPASTNVFDAETSPSVTDHSASGSPLFWAASRTMFKARGSSGVSMAISGLPARMRSLRSSDVIIVAQ